MLNILKKAPPLIQVEHLGRPLPILLILTVNIVGGLIP